MDSVILEGKNGNFEPEYSFREEVASLSKKEVAKIDVGYRGERIVFLGSNTNTNTQIQIQIHKYKYRKGSGLKF